MTAGDGMDTIDLSGLWRCEIPGQTGEVRLPGTLDEAGIGFSDAADAPWHPDEQVNEALRGGAVIATRLTRRFTYTGPARLTRRVRTDLPAGKRVFFECGRARALELLVNGEKAPELEAPTLATARRFEVTGLLTGDDELTLLSDNSYPGWPRAAILASSAATDETQTNWNGVLGAVRLVLRERSFLTSLRVYPRKGSLLVRWEVSGEDAPLTLESEAVLAAVTVDSRRGEALLPLTPGVERWDEGEGRLYTLSASLGAETVTVRFGVRDFTVLDGQFALNGRRLFLRSEANCAVFPETGYEPVDTASWRRIIETYQSYGVNHLRFHSHCPPEAAFEAADELGMLMQPELSNWDPRDAFGDETSRAYYTAELRAILRQYANHPSFVMLSLGNELHAGEEGHRVMARLMDLARRIDPTRLYAPGSNNHYGQRKVGDGADYTTSGSYLGLPLRAANAGMGGWLNAGEPDTDYREAMAAIRRDFSGPVVSFEVGQYEILPDLDEIGDYHGVTDPANLRLVRDRAKARGLLPRWRESVSATGELALLCYRAEVEAALATPGLGGVSLLGLQDFPGQGTALVGMLNAHLSPKPFDFARPERFRAFFTSVLPLLRLKRRAFLSGEVLEAQALMANYGKRALAGAAEWRIAGTGLRGALSPVVSAPGTLCALGKAVIPLSEVKVPAALDLTLSFCGFENTYRLWVYPADAPVRPARIYECRELDGQAEAVLRRGGRVLLAPDSTPEALPGSVKGQFSTDFWSVGTFPQQSGAMGMRIDCGHPLFRGFPTGPHTDWQWRPMAGAYALRVPEGTDCLVTLLDSYAYLRPLAYMLECRCGGGSLLLSSFGLHNIDAPEARALTASIYAYMDSPDFAPRQSLPPETVRAILSGALQGVCEK